MTAEPLVIRADASPRMGTGHVMRCLALAQAWQDSGGRAVFAAAELPPVLRERLVAEGCGVEPVLAAPGSAADAAEMAALARRLGSEWVVLDGYQFGADYQQAVKDSGLRVLAIDDYGHAGRYPADAVLNQNLGADPGWYADRGSGTRLLLGPRYAMLRREFAPYRDFRRDVPEVGRKVLVTLGGADPDNVTLKVVRALVRLDIPGLKAVVVVGGSNPHRTELEAAAGADPDRIDVRVNVENMPELMASADAAVAAGGTTSWERALLGLPGLVVVLADNQEAIAGALDAAGMARSLGWHHAASEEDIAAALDGLLRDPAARGEMARRNRAAVEGRGADRVARVIAGDPAVRLRSAVPDDAVRVWEWANEPAARAWSFTTMSIPWEDHAQWYAGKLRDPGCVFFVVEDASGEAVGQVRFDGADGQEATVSVSLAPAARGRGLGPTALRAGCDALLAARPGILVAALIRPGNAASVRAFEKAGFILAGPTVVHGLPAHRYLFQT